MKAWIHEYSGSVAVIGPDGQERDFCCGGYQSDRAAALEFCAAMNGEHTGKVVRGSVVKFAKPLPDEDASQLYVILHDPEGGRVDISPIGKDWDSLAVRPIQTVLLADLCAF